MNEEWFDKAEIYLDRVDWPIKERRMLTYYLQGLAHGASSVFHEIVGNCNCGSKNSLCHKTAAEQSGEIIERAREIAISLETEKDPYNPIIERFRQELRQYEPDNDD